MTWAFFVVKAIDDRSSLAPGCDCTTPSASSTTIPANGSVDITLKVRLELALEIRGRVRFRPFLSDFCRIRIIDLSRDVGEFIVNALMIEENT
jgi:hypothetical protein